MSWLKPMFSLPVTGDTQRHDGEHVIETSNGDHVGIVIEQCAAMAFC